MSDFYLETQGHLQEPVGTWPAPSWPWGAAAGTGTLLGKYPLCWQPLPLPHSGPRKRGALRAAEGAWQGGTRRHRTCWVLPRQACGCAGRAGPHVGARCPGSVCVCRAGLVGTSTSLLCAHLTGGCGPSHGAGGWAMGQSSQPWDRANPRTHILQEARPGLVQGPMAQLPNLLPPPGADLVLEVEVRRPQPDGRWAPGSQNKCCFRLTCTCLVPEPGQMQRAVDGVCGLGAALSSGPVTCRVGTAAPAYLTGLL